MTRAYTSLLGALTYGGLHGTISQKRAGLCSRSEKDWVSWNAHPCQRHSWLLWQWRPCQLGPIPKRSEEGYMGTSMAGVWGRRKAAHAANAWLGGSRLAAVPLSPKTRD
ncbi:hypothetical protein MPNT_10402 [Candidatus Methylacidithermus pantelleriae]|uniref:Uncharacterized protein n=1 Tax=Candidatus Methylacidithermus pantelleriae TaxID=2744239 RepID=A0A8J2BQK6_9BACT|nr:hypothetical protein MPNT_10402 [Candidatus Methylacidithermus pantelleriae]